MSVTEGLKSKVKAGGNLLWKRRWFFYDQYFRFVNTGFDLFIYTHTNPDSMHGARKFRIEIEEGGKDKNRKQLPRCTVSRLGSHMRTTVGLNSDL